MTSEAVAEATLEQAETAVGIHDDIPTLKSVVQSGNVDVIKSARQRESSQNSSWGAYATDTAEATGATAKREASSPPEHADEQLPDLVCEGDLERTIDAIIEQHMVSMRAEISAVLKLHQQISDPFKIAEPCDQTCDDTIPQSV